MIQNRLAKRICPDCGGVMKLVTAMSARRDTPVGAPLKPVRFICRCGRMVKDKEEY